MEIQVAINLVKGASVAQSVKRWPADLSVPSSRTAEGDNLSVINRVPLHTAFHYHRSIILI